MLKMSSVGKGKEFEKKCIGFLESVFDFICTRDDKKYLVEAKYNKNNIKPILRKSQEAADFVITNDGEEFILIPRDDFDEKIKISEEDDALIKVSTETFKRLDKRKGFNGCVSFDDVMNNLMDQEEENNSK